MTENITSRDARQGRSRLNVFYVLIGGLTLALIAYAVLEVIWR